MKTILYTIILLLLAAATGCEQSTATSAPPPPPGPDPMLVLEERIDSERQLREEAESRAEAEATTKSLWQLVALGLAVITVVGFVAGTALGSRGRHAATTT